MWIYITQYKYISTFGGKYLTAIQIFTKNLKLVFDSTHILLS